MSSVTDSMKRLNRDEIAEIEVNDFLSQMVTLGILEETTGPDGKVTYQLTDTGMGVMEAEFEVQDYEDEQEDSL